LAQVALVVASLASVQGLPTSKSSVVKRAGSSCSGTLTPDVTSAPMWIQGITHNGLASFNSNPSSYQVYRNVKDFGAKGDGVTDDTAAINLAISSGGRCGDNCVPQSSTIQPAVVFFPAGKYKLPTSQVLASSTAILMVVTVTTGLLTKTTFIAKSATLSSI
jgi:hypothetical protein